MGEKFPQKIYIARIILLSVDLNRLLHVIVYRKLLFCNICVLLVLRY